MRAGQEAIWRRRARHIGIPGGHRLFRAEQGAGGSCERTRKARSANKARSARQASRQCVGAGTRWGWFPQDL